MGPSLCATTRASFGVVLLLCASATAQEVESAQDQELTSSLKQMIDEMLSNPKPVAELENPMTRGDPYLLTLQDALETALANDLGLQQRELVTDVARYSYAGSWGAFDPVVTATGSINDVEFEAGNSLQGAIVVESNTQALNAALDWPLLTGGTFRMAFDRQNELTNSQFQFIDPSTTDTLALSLTQPLLRGAWVPYATSTQREAEITYHKELEASRLARQDLIFRLTQAYWDLVAARQQLEVSESTLQLGIEQLEQNRRRLDAGVGTEVDVLQAEANASLRFEERLNAAFVVADAADALKQMLYPGTDPATWDLLIEPITPLPEGADLAAFEPWSEALAYGLAYRADLRAQRLEIDASEIRLARARSERLPGLDLFLSGSSRGFDGDPAQAFEDAVQYEFPNLTAALTINVPIGNRAAYNAYRAARAGVRQAKLFYDELETAAVADIRAAVRDIANQVASIQASARNVAFTRRQLEAEQARYREGLTTTFQVLEFQQQLAESQSSAIQARVGYAKALVNLRRAEGVLGEVVEN